MNTGPRVKLLIESSRAYGQGLLKGIAKYSREHGPWSFMREDAYYLKDTFMRELPEDWLCDGIVALVPDKEMVERIIASSIPAIIIGFTEQISKMPTVVTDDAGVAYIAADHLRGQGFENFAYCGFDDMYWSRQRGIAFAKRLSENGFEVSNFNYCQQEDIHKRDKEIVAMANWLSKLPKPLGVMACNDDRSQHIVKACMLAKLKNPQDVAIIGVDNDVIACELSDVPLTSIALSTEKSGYEAAMLLDKMMGGANVPKYSKIVTRAKCIVRRLSTDVLAIGDVEVVKAVEFIQHKSNVDTCVDDVVEQTCLSRKVLERRFKQEVGESINTTILQKKVDTIKQMLLNTNIGIEKIAEIIGYSSAAYMITSFKRLTGETPCSFRKKCKL